MCSVDCSWLAFTTTCCPLVFASASAACCASTCSRKRIGSARARPRTSCAPGPSAASTRSPGRRACACARARSSRSRARRRLQRAAIRCGQRGGRLRDRVGRLVFLVVQRGFRLAHLRAGASLARREILAVGRQLPRVDDGDHLIPRHPIAFDDRQLRQPSIDLRADDDVVGGDDAGEDERGRACGG